MTLQGWARVLEGQVVGETVTALDYEDQPFKLRLDPDKPEGVHVWGSRPEAELREWLEVKCDSADDGGPKPFPVASLAGKPYPPQPWAVEQVIAANTLTCLDGPEGAGKSGLMLHASAAVVLGRPWCGWEVAEGSALYVSAEDPEPVLHRRLADIAVNYDVGLEDLTGPGFDAWDLADLEPEFAVPDGHGGLRWTPLWEQFRERLLDTRPTITTLDSRSDFFLANESDRALVRQFTGSLRRLAQAAGSSLVLLGHPSLNRADGSSGSTGWRSGARGAWTLEPPPVLAGQTPDHDARVLTHRKNSFGPLHPPVKLRRADGVLHRVGGPTSRPDHRAEQNRVDEVFMRLFDAYRADGRPMSANPGKTYAPILFARDARREGIEKDGFKAAMERALAAKRIDQVVAGRPGKERGRLVLGGER